MCTPANAAFLHSSFPQWPSLQNPLDLPPLWRQLIQRAVGVGEIKKAQQHFSNLGDTKALHGTLK
jgi:hypothetical protein